MRFLQMSFCGAVLVAAIALLRAALLYRLPKRTFLALWTLALCRLWLPFSLPAACSVYALLAPLTGPTALSATVGDGPVQPLLTDGAPGPMTPTGEGAPAADPATGPAVGGETLDGRTPGGVASPVAALPSAHPSAWVAVWALGCFGCLAAFSGCYLRGLRLFRQSLPIEAPFVAAWLGRQRLRRRVRVRCCDRVATPLTYGILCPVILLPKGLPTADTQALRYVLAHELVHIRRFDGIYKLLLAATACLHWFNPLAWLMFLLANRDLELACDEAVLRAEEGQDGRAAYARTLIAFAQTGGGPAPLSNGFGKNAIEERIVAIMKQKKTTLAALLAAVLLFVGVGAAFATSAPTSETPPARQGQTLVAGTGQSDPLGTAPTPAEQTLLCYTDPTTGQTRYSDDGGQTYMSEADFAQKYPADAVEWWSAEEYARWLEEEKLALQALLGQTAWTGSRGSFVWTQQLIDEAIAQYQATLDSIRAGCRVSKPLGAGSYVVLGLDPATEPDWQQYRPFGLTFEGAQNALYYNGEKVRYFEDSVELGDGGVAARCYYHCQDGTVSLCTVRRAQKNPDGSTDPFGPILRLETLTDQQAAVRIRQNSPQAASVTMTAYAADALEDDGPVQTEGQTTVQATTEQTAGDVTASSGAEASLAMGTEGGGTGEGIPLPQMFDKYKPYGITYEEVRRGDEVERNLYYNGRLVSQFADVTPDGGVFTFGSSRQTADGVRVRTVYKGRELVGVQLIED